MSRAKRIIPVAALLMVIVGGVGGIKALQIHQMIAAASGFSPPPETITTAKAEATRWPARLSSVGSLAAAQGVTVAAEVPGKVVHIAFQSGAKVRAGALLLRLDTSSEKAQLRA